MNIKNIKKTSRGNAVIIAMVISVILGVISVTLITQLRTESAVQKNAALDGKLLSTAHSIAALFKQDLLTNYANFATAPWAACVTSGQAINFFHILVNPSDASFAGDPTNCPPVDFVFNYFQNANSRSSVPLSAFMNQVYTPITQINGLTAQFVVTDYNFSTERNQITSNLTISAPSTTGGPVVSKTLRMAIDIQRTLSSLSTDTNCKICRTVPGAVCCGGSISLTYLEGGSGNVVAVTYDETTHVTTEVYAPIAPYPTAVSMKGYPPGVVYGPDSFCNSAISPDPIPYMIDAAVLGPDTYFLTNNGTLYQNSTVIAVVPTLISFGYDPSSMSWLLLRSDGAVLQTMTLNDPTTYQPLQNFILPKAQSLIVGDGPAIAAPCY